jgi:hypothetical protein
MGLYALLFLVDCEVTLTSVSGVIESPNFPNPYPGKRSCAWKIQSTYGNTLNVSFSHFDLEAQSTCTSDYLQVREVDRMHFILHFTSNLRFFEKYVSMCMLKHLGITLYCCKSLIEVNAVVWKAKLNRFSYYPLIKTLI